MPLTPGVVSHTAGDRQNPGEAWTINNLMEMSCLVNNGRATAWEERVLRSEGGGGPNTMRHLNAAVPNTLKRPL